MNELLHIFSTSGSNYGLDTWDFLQKIARTIPKNLCEKSSLND